MCEKRNCGCNKPGNAVICYTNTPVQPCIGVNLTVNNTQSPDGSTDTSMILEETNNISAYKEHLEFVNSPEPLSGLKRNVVLRLAESFINTIANIFRGTNVGTGTDIYKGPRSVGSDTFHDFKRLKDSESINFQGGTNDIIAVVDQDWLEDQFPEIPVVDYPVTGAVNIKTEPGAVGLYKGLVNKTLQNKSLMSNDIIIQEIGDDVWFKLPGGGSTSDYYYLDPYYVRPITWGTELNPKEEILNTTIHPTPKKIPTGRLNDPFIDYTEFLLFAVGNEADGNIYGNYTTGNPKNTNRALQILNGISTNQRIEVNGWQVFLNKATLAANVDPDEYSLDMRRLWTSENFDPLTGKIKRPIYFLLGGEGTFTRYNGLGLIYSKGDVTKTSETLAYGLSFLPTGLGINIVEADNPFPDTNPNVRLTRADGTTLLNNGNSPVFGRVQEPDTPLIVIDGSTFQFWGTLVTGTKLFIVAKTQPHIKFINGGNLSSSSEQIMYQVHNGVIGYERKMIENAPGNTPEENAFLAGRKNGSEVGFYYKAFEDYIVFDIGEDCNFRVENLSTEANAFIHAGAHAVIKIAHDGVFNNVVSWKDTGGGSAYNLIKTIGTPEYLKITDLEIASIIDTIIEGDGVSTTNLIISNTQLNNVRKISKDVPTLTIYTAGTLCSIQGKAIISLVGYASNADALADDVLKDTLYRNTITGNVAQVY